MDDKPSVIRSVKYLAALDDPDGVADHMLRYGITGRRGTSNTCPVANYLKNVTGNEAIYVNGRNIMFKLGRASVFIPTPAPVAQFVQAFDNGEYPALEEIKTDESLLARSGAASGPGA